MGGHTYTAIFSQQKSKVEKIQGLTLCGGVLVNVDFTCRKSVRLVMSNLAGHLHQALARNTIIRN
jgi:hypothetical protein